MKLERLRTMVEQFMEEYGDRVDDSTVEACNSILDSLADLLYEDVDGEATDELDPMEEMFERDVDPKR